MPHIDLQQLSDHIVEADVRRESCETQAGLLWLFAHFIALKTAGKRRSLHSSFLKAVHKLLSVAIASPQARATFITAVSKGPGEVVRLSKHAVAPPYVSVQLGSLVDGREISLLLEQFALYVGPVRYTHTHSGPSTDQLVLGRAWSQRPQASSQVISSP